MKWYQNKYLVAATVALATGLINACLAYVTHITDGLDWRHMTQDVGVAFLGPFMILVSVLPKVQDILVPTVRIVSQEQVAELAQAAPEKTIITTEPETTVAIGNSLTGLDTTATTPYRGTQKNGETITVEPPPITVT